MRYTITGALCLVLAACTQQEDAIKTVREAQASEVVNCALVGRVTGVPGVFGPLAKAGLNDARRAAKRLAFEQGGNTIVFDPVPSGEVITEVKGAVYRC